MNKMQIIYPAFAMVLLTLFAYVKMRLILNKYISSREFKFNQIKIYSGNIPEELEQSRQHLKNLFELPVLFYLLTALLFSSNNIDQIDIILAWVFVVSRYMHSYIRFSTNHVPHRAIFFVFGLFILIVAWTKIVIMGL